MAHSKNEYKIQGDALRRPEEPGFKTFSSQEEAGLYRLKKNLARTDMERFKMLCRLIRINKMLTQKP